MKIAKAIKAVGQEVVKELQAMDSKALKDVIVQGQQSMQTAQDELDKNANYQKAKDDVAILGQAKKDVDKYQKAKIKLALYRIKNPAERLEDVA